MIHLCTVENKFKLTSHDFFLFLRKMSYSKKPRKREAHGKMDQLFQLSNYKTDIASKRRNI